jgi:hypothetical protein
MLSATQKDLSFNKGINHADISWPDIYLFLDDVESLCKHVPEKTPCRPN